jgi:acetolactate synthase-1/2/3 large subunit
LNNNSWGGVSINQRLFYPHSDSWDFQEDIRYDKIFELVGCHGEHVEERDGIKPALERAYNSGKPAVINVPSTPTHTHPVTLRMQLQERWTRGDLNELGDEARAELKRLSPRAVRRGQKMFMDMGVFMPLEELVEIAGCSVEDARRYPVAWKEE